MNNQAVDLNSHINQDVQRGNAADFPVMLRAIFQQRPEGYEEIPHRRAVVRQDTGEAIAVVSSRYTVVPHQRILDAIERAIQPLDVGPVPRGVYVDRRGANMRAVFKFPALARAVRGMDEVCPCVQVRNTYDGTSRISIHIGAFRFVCTNLAVGGGGVFAGGFMSVHAGEIPIATAGEQLADYLTRFEGIVDLYRHWESQSLGPAMLDAVLRQVLKGQYADLRNKVLTAAPATVMAAYNTLTDHATHQMRTARTAFGLLERVNASFQAAFPLTPAPSQETAEALALA